MWYDLIMYELYRREGKKAAGRQPDLFPLYGRAKAQMKGGKSEHENTEE
jgi:hypothetical protein